LGKGELSNMGKGPALKTKKDNADRQKKQNSPVGETKRLQGSMKSKTNKEELKKVMFARKDKVKTGGTALLLEGRIGAEKTDNRGKKG